MSLSIDAIQGAEGRAQIDHRLLRQHVINEYRRGRIPREQVCDAQRELIRAATNVGTALEQPCPICDEHELKLVTYVFGARLPKHGRCVSTAKEMRVLRRRREESSAYVVEVCAACGWNHLRKVLPIGGGAR